MNVSLREREEFAHKVLSFLTTSFRDARRMIRHILTRALSLVKDQGVRFPVKHGKCHPATRPQEPRAHGLRPPASSFLEFLDQAVSGEGKAEEGVPG